MNRRKIIEQLASELSSFGRVIYEDLLQKYETKPYLYLSVLRSEANSEGEQARKYDVEIVYVPKVRADSTLELYDKADELGNKVAGFTFADAVENIETIVDALGTQAIYVSFVLVFFV